MSIANIKKVGSAVAFALASAAASVHAAPIQFTFDCTITSATTCAPGGPFGTLTLSNSSVDPNRVDVDLVIYPHAGVTGVNKFFMNTNVVVPANHDWRLLLQSAPTGSFNTNLNGSVGYITDGLGPGIMFTFDLDPDPPNTALLTYSGSLLLASTLAGHAEFDLNVSMFNVKDENNQLYAGFNTVPNGTSLNAGATTSIDLGGFTPSAQIPEPTALLLALTAVASFAFALRRRA